MLGYIAGKLHAAGINYQFMDYVPTDGENLPQVFWVGEFFEEPVLTESGMVKSEFVITGTCFGSSALPLIEDKRIIEKLFTPGQRAILGSGNGIHVSYNNSQIIPSEEPTIKRLELSLSVNEWKVD